ncbi:hypothetical protein BGZ65_005436 [Modicella reniformis]|uniref:EamA domain-containing protein n=1 Tax=Modicella reniformis TaxID=1440133 RepID=A0A9P6J7P1_9FUNG|nr:hypothetical protein BGZ65_005436 [Modicella reniformis]
MRTTGAQNIFANQNYSKPFFVTYINTASFSLYLLGPLFKQCLGRSSRNAADKVIKPSTRSAKSLSSYGSFNSSDESLDTLTCSESTLERGSETTHSEDIPLTNREVAQLSLTFCIIWFAANWATNASLAYTSVASSTILSSMSGFFTLAIGAALKTETVNALKLLAIFSTVLGVVLVSKSDHGNLNVGSTSPRAPLLGDFLALISAFFYGCYTVLLKIRIQNESRVNMPLFFGFVGSDYLWLLSMLMTSPLVVTLGLSLTIPLALVGDIVGHGRILGMGYWIGAGLVLTGFFGVNGAALMENNEKERNEDDTTIEASPSLRRRPAEVESSSPTSPSSPWSAHPSRAGSSASSMLVSLPDDYNPLQYPPPSRVRAGAKPDLGDTSDLEPADDNELPVKIRPGTIQEYQMKDNDLQIGGFHTRQDTQNIQGRKNSKSATTYKLRLPIQPKEVIKGARLALEGCYIALTNPSFKHGQLYKTLFRLLLFTLIAHLVTQILFFLPMAVMRNALRVLSYAIESDTSDSQRGLEMFSNKAHELMSSIPLLGLLFLRYLYPQPLDNIFVDALEYSDHLLLQDHARAKMEQSKNPNAVDPLSPSIFVMDHRGPFTPALLAYPYKVQTWREMWRYMRRTWKRLKWALLFLVLSWIPVLGRFAFPVASFLSTIQAIGSKPLAIAFAITSFMLPRSLSIYLLKGFFGCRALTRELLDPYFIRIGMNHHQKRKWFNYRKSVLLGFGIVFYVCCSIPIIGVAVYGLAQASSAFVLQSLADPPPPPVLKANESPKRQDSRSKKQ